MPTRSETFVLTQLSFFQVIGYGIGKLNLQLLQGRFAIGLKVQTIKRLQCKCHVVVTHVVCQRNEVKVISGGVTLENQHALDAQNFTFSRNGKPLAVVVHNRGFQRFITDQLPNASFNAIKATENLHRALYAGCLPASHRFEFFEHRIEAMSQVCQYMISVTRETVLCMNCGCGTTDQNGVRQDALKACCR